MIDRTCYGVMHPVHIDRTCCGVPRGKGYLAVVSKSQVLVVGGDNRNLANFTQMRCKRLILSSTGARFVLRGFVQYWKSLPSVGYACVDLLLSKRVTRESSVASECSKLVKRDWASFFFTTVYVSLRLLRFHKKRSWLYYYWSQVYLFSMNLVSFDSYLYCFRILAFLSEK